MREAKKKLVTDSAHTLLRGAESLRRIKKTASDNEYNTLLAEMQQLAICIGEAIEESEKDSGQYVAELENLCELLYQIGEAERESEAERLLEDVKSCADRACTVIAEQIPVKKEILFLPYQVSMWDSLESVWRAASEDESADCYVVPIPYYDVVDGKITGDLHYEGERYPEDVPVTYYEEYEIEERRPDMIFIHNPYDQYNTVTRIPERYYAKYIKDFTKQLVYIPYLVSEPEGPSEGMCFLPGTIYADKVIVQPGGVYEKYCKVYDAELERLGWTGKCAPAKDKFLPLGSPKFDKLLSLHPKIEDLPEAWQKVILRPDGTRKKIILYNLTIGELLQNSSAILDKIDSVFRFFKERQDELALLWRPHPLLMKTIHSMRPSMQEAYTERVNRFREEGWGIFDDTADSNLAMALSDAYYGDMSSLVTSYRETGKPIMIQDVGIIDY